MLFCEGRLLNYYCFLSNYFIKLLLFSIQYFISILGLPQEHKQYAKNSMSDPTYLDNFILSDKDKDFIPFSPSSGIYSIT